MKRGRDGDIFLHYQKWRCWCFRC